MGEEEKGFKSGGVVRSSPPTPDQRCTRNDGRGWRCNAFKFQGRRFCEYHYVTYELREKMNDHHQKNKGVHKKRQKRKGGPCFSDSSEEEEVIRPPMKRRKRQMRLASSSSDEEQEVQTQPTEDLSMEWSITELILSLKTSNHDNDFDKVVFILKLREENVKMEKEVAEKNAARFKKEWEMCEVNCNKLLKEAEDKRMREVNAVEDKLREFEVKRVVVEEKLHWYKRMSVELKTKNIYLESDNTRTENEVGLWKKRLQEQETKGFLTDVYVEPKSFPTDISYTEEGKRNVTRQMRTEGRGYLSNIKIEEEALNFSAKIYHSSSSVDFPAKESGVGQHAGVKDGSAGRDKKPCQPEGSSHKTLISPKNKHGSITTEQMASQQDGSSYKMLWSPAVGILRPCEGITKMNNSQETKAKLMHFQEGSGQKQNGAENGSYMQKILASTTKRISKEGTIDSACEDPQLQINKCRVRTREGLASGFDHGNACKIPGNDNMMEVKDCGPSRAAGFNDASANARSEHVRDGISKFLQELRKLKANKVNWKGCPLVVE